MKDFIEYLTDQFEAGKNDIARLEADGRKDDADFANVLTKNGMQRLTRPWSMVISGTQ